MDGVIIRLQFIFYFLLCVHCGVAWISSVNPRLPVIVFVLLQNLFLLGATAIEDKLQEVRGLNGDLFWILVVGFEKIVIKQLINYCNQNSSFPYINTYKPICREVSQPEMSWFTENERVSLHKLVISKSFICYKQMRNYIKIPTL